MITNSNGLKSLILLCVSFTLSSCGFIESRKIESMEEDERLHMLMTKTDTELCKAYNHSSLKPKTEMQIEKILRSRKINKCDERSKVRLVPPDLTVSNPFLPSLSTSQAQKELVTTMSATGNYGSPRTTGEFEEKIFKMYRQPNNSKISCSTPIKGHLKFKNDNLHVFYGYQAICDVLIKGAFGRSDYNIDDKKTPYLWEGTGEFTEIDLVMSENVDFYKIKNDQYADNCKTDSDCESSKFCGSTFNGRYECRIKSNNAPTSVKTNETISEPKASVLVTPANNDISKLESTCSRIGFKKGTEQFGDCVLELKARATKRDCKILCVTVYDKTKKEVIYDKQRRTRSLC